VERVRPSERLVGRVRLEEGAHLVLGRPSSQARRAADQLDVRQVAGRELIVIASRDDEHDAMVFTTDDWDEVRRSNVPNRDAMLQRCAITDHARLVELLAAA